MGFGVPQVLPDANVLYSRTLRDWLCAVAALPGHPVMRIRWTEDILAETLYHLRKSAPHASEAQICGVRDRFIEAVGDGRIRGYRIDEALDYTDDCDAHLHAAAEHAQVQYVITADKDYLRFAAGRDDLNCYEAYTPDDFLVLVQRDAAPAVEQALLDEIAYFRRRGRPFNLVSALERAGAPRFAAEIRGLMQSPMVAHALTRPLP